MADPSEEVREHFSQVKAVIDRLDTICGNPEHPDREPGDPWLGIGELCVRIEWLGWALGIDKE